MYKMDPYENVSIDNLRDICQKMDLATLNKYIRSSKSAYAACKQILDKRLLRFQEYRRDLSDPDNIELQLYKFENGFKSTVSIVQEKPNGIPSNQLSVYQNVFIQESKMPSWPLNNNNLTIYNWGDSINPYNKIPTRRLYYQRNLLGTAVDQLPHIIEEIEGKGYIYVKPGDPEYKQW